MVRQMSLATVCAWKPGKAGETFGAVAPEPTLQCSFAHQADAGEVCKGDVIGQVQFEDAVALDRQRRNERRMRHRRQPIA